VEREGVGSAVALGAVILHHPHGALRTRISRRSSVVVAAGLVAVAGAVGALTQLSPANQAALSPKHPNQRSGPSAGPGATPPTTIGGPSAPSPLPTTTAPASSAIDSPSAELTNVSTSSPTGGFVVSTAPANPSANGPATAPAPPADAPVGAAPAGGTPAGGTPAGGTPVGAAPAGGTPVGAAPAGGTPAGGTPAGGTPAGGTPAGGTPAGGTPAGGTPAGGTPAGGTPAGGTPAAGTPAAGTPAAGTPAGGTPAGGTPVGAAPVGAAPTSTTTTGPTSTGFGEGKSTATLPDQATSGRTEDQPTGPASGDIGGANVGSQMLQAGAQVSYDAARSSAPAPDRPGTAKGIPD
jgi:hypothetical protein